MKKEIISQIETLKDRTSEVLDAGIRLEQLEENFGSISNMMETVERESVLVQFLFYNKMSANVLLTMSGKRPKKAIKQLKTLVADTLTEYTDTGDLTKISEMTDYLKNAWSEQLSEM